MNPAKQAAKTTQDIAQTIAKQIVQEPIEILKDAGAQVVGIDTSKPQDNLASERLNGQTPSGQPNDETSAQQKLKGQTFAQRRMQALQNEINDIRKQDIFKDLQARISGGEYIPLQDYTELSMEQKQVLKAQMEAVKKQMINAKYANAKYSEVPSVSSKPSRRFGAGQKHEAEKQQTRVEKPIPPSG